MSAKTEPKTHSPAATAAHSPAEAPEPIAVLVSCAALWIELRAFLRVRAGETLLRHLSHSQDPVGDRRRIRNAAT